MNSNKKQRNQEDDYIDIAGVLDMVSEMIGDNINNEKSPQSEKRDSNNNNESITLNDIFNISARLMKESNISESLSKLLKNNHTNDINEQDTSPDKPIKKKNKQTNDPFISGILTLITGFVKEENKKSTDLKVQNDIKILRRRVRKIKKDLLELKQKVNDTNKSET